MSTYATNPQVTSVLDRLEEIAVIPVITIDNPSFAVPLARALVAGGLPAAEVTFRTPCAAECIARMAAEVPELLVGAGTVLDVPTTQAALEAGARFIVSPGLAEDSVAYCVGHNVPVVPGLSTPSELMRALRLGVTHVKLFPAELAGGTAALHAMGGPFPQVKFMCTGGIKPTNAPTYLAAPNVFCVGGTWIAPADVVSAGDFATVERLVREASTLIS